MKRIVMRVFKLGLDITLAQLRLAVLQRSAHTVQALVHTLHLPIPYKLHLRLMRDGLEIGVQDRGFRVAGFVVTVAVGSRCGVESLA